MLIRVSIGRTPTVQMYDYFFNNGLFLKGQQSKILKNNNLYLQRMFDVDVMPVQQNVSVPCSERLLQRRNFYFLYKEVNAPVLSALQFFLLPHNGYGISSGKGDVRSDG